MHAYTITRTQETHRHCKAYRYRCSRAEKSIKRAGTITKKLRPANSKQQSGSAPSGASRAVGAAARVASSHSTLPLQSFADIEHSEHVMVRTREVSVRKGLLLLFVVTALHSCG